MTTQQTSPAARSGRRAKTPGAALATLLLGLSIFATGFAGLVSEFVLGTVSSYILGNSIEQFSIIIALMMLMMGVAGALQRFFPDRNLVGQFIAVEMALALLGGFAPLAIYAAFGLLEDHFLLVLYFFVAAIGCLIGFELPLVLRINARYVDRLPNNLAVILGLDYVGGFVGALVWTRYLLRELPLTETSFVIAGVNFAIASLTYWHFMRLRERGEDALLESELMGRPGRAARALATLGIALVGVTLALGYAYNREWGDRLEQHLYDDRIVFAETTPYQRIVMTHDAIRDDYRLYLNGNLQLSSVDEHVYHEQLVHPAMSIAALRSRVLILGGGDGLALREVLKYSDVRHVSLVDLDRRMTELAARHPLFVALNGGALADARVRLPEPGGVGAGERVRVLQARRGVLEEGVEEVARVRVINVDADRFVSALPGLFDVVIIDFPDPNSVELTKLYSREFYRKLKGVLAPEAVVALQSTSPYHAREAFLCIQRTVEAAGYETFPYHDDVPSFGSWGWLLAAPAARGSEPLARRVAAVEALAVDTVYLTPALMARAGVFGKGRLRATREGVNTLMHPMLLDLYLRASWIGD